MHGSSLYRIKAADLADEGLDAKTLGQKVERYSTKPICDGISIDKDNNIYLGDPAENAIGVIKPDRSYIRLAQSTVLSWVDSLSFGPEGSLSAVFNQLPGWPALKGGKALSKAAIPSDRGQSPGRRTAWAVTQALEGPSRMVWQTAKICSRSHR